MPDPLIGRQLGKYQIQQEIGRGGMARVYRAQDTVLQRAVALKVLAPGLSADPEFARRFEREAITAANLRHPAVVTIFDVGEAEGLRYIAMEYIAGRTLNDVLTEHGKLGVPLTIAILAPVAEALDFAHSNGMVHRDVKPHNIMLDTDGRVLLTDFGIAIDPAEGGERLTRTGMFMGTPEYISPEQAQAQPLGGRSDQYSLGIVAYEMLAGRVPFEGNTPQQIMAHVYQTPPQLRILDPQAPPELDQIFTRVLAKDPNGRFERAGQVVEALRYVARRYNMGSATRDDVAALAIPLGSSAGQATVAMRTPPGGPAAPAQPPTPRQQPPATGQPGAAAAPFPIADVFGSPTAGTAPRQGQPTGQRAPHAAPTAPMRTPPSGTPVAGAGRPPGQGAQRGTGQRAYSYSGGDDQFVPPPRIPRRRAYDDHAGSSVPWTMLAIGAVGVIAILLVILAARGDAGMSVGGPPTASNPFARTETPLPTATEEPTPGETSAPVVFPTMLPSQSALPVEELPTQSPTPEPPTPEPTATEEPPTATPAPPTATAEPPTATPTPTVFATSTPLSMPSPTAPPVNVPTPAGGGGSLGYFDAGTLMLLDPSTRQPRESFTFNFDMQGPVAISPDGKTILVDAADPNGVDRHIFAIDRARGTRRQLTSGSGLNFNPSWRPDGNAIVFASTRGGTAHIFTMDPDGSNVRALTNGASDNRYPSFAPDGTRVLFESNRDGQLWSIYVMDAQGGPVTRLSQEGKAFNDQQPRWSPDGQQMVFVSDRDRNNGFEVYTQRLATGEFKRLTIFPSGSSLGPNFSPDGKLIAFFTDRSGNNDIVIADTATGAIVFGPPTAADERWPVWSR